MQSLKIPKRPGKEPGLKNAAGGRTNVWRINILVLSVFLISGIVTYRLFNLALVNHADFLKIAVRQQENPSASLSGRGSIYFSDFSPGSSRKIVAANKSSVYLHADNKILDSEQAEIARKLAVILESDPLEIEARLIPRDKSYVLISAGLSKDQAEKIKNLQIKGLSLSSQVERFYPLGISAAHAVGFVGFKGRDRVGQYGVEAFYDETLRAPKRDDPNISGWSGNGYVDSLTSLLNFFGLAKERDKEIKVAPSEGSDIVLSIDKNIQSVVEARLNQTLKKWSAPSGLIIVQDPRSGSILAVASSPSFDPNRYQDYGFEDFINPVSQEVYEPGSSLKPITMSAAIDSKAIKPETTYHDTGEFHVAGYTIKNFDEKPHGLQTMRNVLEKSLNTGAIFAQQKTGDDNFLNYVVAFGFGQKTGVDLAGEISGNISNLYSGRKINFATASFGQGIAVTPIQLINAYSAMANGGKLMRPILAAKIIKADGSQTDIEPEIIDSPITEATARQLQSMLVDVVDKGFDKARIRGYDVAGKTGTAQIPAPDGGYLGDDQFIHNFVGFAPAYDARFTVLIKMDRPKGIKFAADSLSPVFGEIARYLIRYFNIPPTRK